ncbi:LppU/SCO3897 family protein [Actinokineospora sp. G85]|uniref:LppU/SCO3897 family protein n=1 Tax=Actinokineospora sp. G85 TaxID=3406626 RepID=UPI003C736C52
MYGQQPPHGQAGPEGQWFGATAPPAGVPHPGQPQGATSKVSKISKKRKLIGAAAILVLVVVAGVVGVVSFTKSPASADAGDCIKVNRGGATSADVDKIDCADQEAVFVVGKKLDSATATCPDGDYQQYTSSGRGSSFALCLVVNAKKGDCFDDILIAAQAKRVACASAEYEVLDVIEGRSEPEACAGALNTNSGLIYAEPPRVVCMEERK